MNAKDSDYLLLSSRDTWGGAYNHKPKCQVDWDRQVRGAVASICSADAVSSKADLRPRLLDQSSGLSVLLDTGACCSIWPRAKFKNTKPDHNRQLQAVNGTRIPTYGNRSVVIKPTQRGPSYRHEVILADISEPIVGFNFLVQFQLDLK